ncbi:hypothetical protein VT84_06280 [Gemmata sp. SH-PL17]|uniref:hypothetical protein n=1 Tax=Gemmata sp. SH-PL17 TaxID=1630693 RepID=UPI00078BC98F|nr:hypothetical protein [Gemmata sp. SH-PL17]AMV23983.1 hypothetical protein VT84_06280 [Gemmata sp. SH-PL17]
MRADEFVRGAIEWVAIRDAVRAAYPGDTSAFYTTVCALYREFAWAHLLFRKGQYAPAVARLRSVCEGALNITLPVSVPTHPSRDEVLAFAVAIRARFRSVVVARYPAAFNQFGRPKARFRRSA